VLVFPVHPLRNGTGRVIVYEDGDFRFFTGAGTPNFESFDPATPATGARGQIVTEMDLPQGVVVGPATGMGPGAVLPAPLAGIDVTRDCSFCGALPDRRGAIRFDGRGRPSFLGANGTGTRAGGSLSVTATELAAQRTLLVLPATGAVRVLDNG
jgi:hypothetical protein